MKKFRLLTADEIECRVAQIKASGLSLLLYKDARCDMNILDECVGMMNWQKRYSRDNRNCEVGIYDSEKKEWIWKEDTGTESNTEQEKGLASDSFKRACFNWGVGRELYSAPFIWIGKESCNIEANGQRYVCSDRFKVSSISYDDRERISYLRIINSKNGKTVYEWRNGKLSRSQLITLERVLVEHDHSEEDVCEYFRVKKLSDLNTEQFKKLMDSMGESA